MTTTQLSPVAHHFTWHDVQALRDFAVEAPYAWRKILTELADIADGARKDGSFEDKYGSLRDFVKQEAVEMRVTVAKLDVTNIEHVREDLTTHLTELEEACND